MTKKLKQINFESIKTPTTVEEFRVNLRKYYVCITNWSGKRDRLMTFHSMSNAVDYEHGHDINKLNSLSDLYELEGTFSTPQITPTIEFNTRSLTDIEVVSNMMTRDYSFVMSDKSRFKIFEINDYKDQSSYMKSVKDVNWYTIDNQILRSFYAKTLGEFSGYVSVENNFSDDQMKIITENNLSDDEIKSVINLKKQNKDLKVWTA